ncbi:hypothetical protein MRB53_027298 [Persea americana]|uniref:Uncharacterized protein n=1 Tax=Persea americana TaxID=3435 RepID=A0ACC2LLI9_PERAE|nr:hypothetical protein MRB53_027298 [Persea americana]
MCNARPNSQPSGEETTLITTVWIVENCRVLKWGMGKGSKIGCKMASHQLFKDKAKNRVDDLQGMFTDLQFARKESRSIDVAVLEEQVHQMLREWKAKLNEASPASLHLVKIRI